MKAKQLSVNLVLAALMLAGIAPAIAQEPELPPVPGTVEGTGTYFEVTDSEYLNVTLGSSELVSVMLKSVPSTVSAFLEAADGATTTEITLGGLAPSTTYYKYEDSYENGIEITTDAAGSYAWTQDLSGPHLIWFQPNPSTKFIRDDATGGDCTMIGAWDPGTLTCTLQTDVLETIEIISPGITIDGAGYTVHGSGEGYGIKTSYGKHGVTIKNVNVVGFSTGIFVLFSDNSTIMGNTVSDNVTNVELFFSNDYSVTGNDTSSGKYYGTRIVYCDRGTVADNTSNNDRLGFHVYRSPDSLITRNSASDNLDQWAIGFNLWRAERSTVTHNTATSNTYAGFQIDRSHGSHVERNTATNSRYGMTIHYSHGCTVAGNILSSNEYGIRDDHSDNNVIYENTISDNTVRGIEVGYCLSEQIYNNNFIDNATQALVYTSTDVLFNLTAPTGGNYWSDWTTPNDDGDNFVDLPYAFQFGEDLLPWTTPNGWLNQAPVADAGENTQIPSADQVYTIIYGEATDPDGDMLQYRWLRGEEVLLDWSEVGATGEAHLDLAPLPYLEIGNHTLTLEVTDPDHTAIDTMVLTIENSPPEVQPAPSSQVAELGIDPITVVAEVADFDGDTLTYECLKNGEVLDSGTVGTIQGGDSVQIPDLVVPPGDPRFPLGSHIIEVRVHDSINDPVSAFVTVDVIDTTAPSLSPIPSVTMLWPPNHTLRPITIEANAYDNGGGMIHLEVSVSSSEPPDLDGDGNTIPDYYIDSVNDVTGVIELRLRSERSGKGEGRTYTVNITASDESGNESHAQVNVRAPHDRRKK